MSNTEVMQSCMNTVTEAITSYQDLMLVAMQRNLESQTSLEEATEKLRESRLRLGIVRLEAAAAIRRMENMIMYAAIDTRSRLEIYQAT